MDRAPRLWVQLSAAPQALAGIGALPSLGMEDHAGTRAELYGTIGVMAERVSREGATDVAPRIATQALTPTGQNLPSYLRVRDTVSYIGVRGGVPIGTGPELFYQLESSLSYSWVSDGGAESAAPSSSTPNTGLRESAIGLRQSAWGSLFFGQWDMPIKEAFSSFDPFGGNSLASNYNLIGTPGFGVGLVTGPGPASFSTDANNDDASFNRRHSGVIQYWSPEWRGFSMRAAYSNMRRRAAPDVDFGRIWGLSATWRKGIFTVAAGYERHDNYFGIASLGRNNRGVGSDSANTAGTSSMDYSWRVGAMATFGATEVSLTADRLSYREFGVVPFNTTPDLSRYQRTAWVLNMTHKIGKWELRAGYGQASAGSCEVIVVDPAQGACTTDGLGARHQALGFNYALGKGIDIFGHYARLENAPSSSYNFGTGGVFAGAGRTPGVGADLKGYGVGVKYTF
jgi:predicted porin